MQIILHPLILPLATPFRISHGVRTEQPTLIVELRAEDGTVGYGEAPMTSYYGLRSDDCSGVLRRIGWLPVSTPEELHEWLDAEHPGLHPFLRCALDVATHDIWAKRQGKRLGELWEQAGRQTPTCFTLGIGSVEESVSKVRATPWPVYKIKLGGEHDLEVLRALRAATDSPFYVDANTGWTAEQTIALAPELKSLGVVFIEQPLPVADTEGQRRVKRECVLPTVADESCQTEEDVAACAELFDGINVKVVKCGGLLPARRMIRDARRRGLRIMAGCMTESSFGISGIAQLLPELDYADLDGAMLLAEDPAEGVRFDPRTGHAIYPDRAGTGAAFRL